MNMEKYGIIKEQKWVESYVWNKLTFNKYLIKFENDNEYYVINRNEKIEQALINAKIIYSLKNDNQISNHKIIGYSTNEEYKLLSLIDLKEMCVEMYKRGFNNAKEKNETYK